VNFLCVFSITQLGHKIRYCARIWRCFLAAKIKNCTNIEKMQKTLDKRRKHVLDYLTLIQYLVHFLVAIHNIWIGAIVLFLHFPEGWTSAVVRTEES
jgi:hypothetical protein